MSFTLGGPGTILPPRKKQSDQGSVVQESAPAFTEPGIRVVSDGQTNRLPIDTPKNVIEIGSRKRFRSLPEVVQTAIAKSGGVVVPIANLRAAPQRRLGATPSTLKTDLLCTMVFIVEAARCKRGLSVTAGTKTVTKTPEEIAEYAVEKVIPALNAIMAAKPELADVVAQCQADYYTKYGKCGKDGRTRPPAEESPKQEKPPVSEDLPPSPPVSEEVPPEPPPAPPAPTPEPPPPAPPVIVIPETPPVVEEKKKQGMGNLWWLVALIGGGLLIKKLAAVKVIGAAVAGVPLVAEMDDSDETEEAHEEDEPGETPEAHEIEE
jgi:hypothetical protein